MDKKRPWHNLHSGLPPFVSEEADREQLRQMPKASESSLIARMEQPSKAEQAPTTSENNPDD